MGDLERIDGFLKNLQNDLQDYVNRYDFLVPHHPELKFNFLHAWDEIGGMFTFPKLTNEENAIVMLRLRDAGLSGKQLDLKLRLIENARAEYEVVLYTHDHLARIYGDEKNVDRKSALEKLLNTLKRLVVKAKKALLDKDDIPLSSLVQAIPLFGETLAEFKDAAISTLDYE